MAFFGIALLLVALSPWGWVFLREPHAGRYQVARNVEPAGLSVDPVQWGNSSESPFRTHSVDLWPLITITPERLKSLHITEPYVETEFAFLVRSGSPFESPQDLANATIGLANISIDSVKLHSLLPNAHADAQPGQRAPIAALCAQRVDAAFMDTHSAIAAFIGRSRLRRATLALDTRAGRAKPNGHRATFKASAAADIIREEIGIMARKGGLAPIIGKWGFTSSQSLVSM
jgi:ABC-type amino acid transport substrate-binding protein